MFREQAEHVDACVPGARSPHACAGPLIQIMHSGAVVTQASGITGNRAIGLVARRPQDEMVINAEAIAKVVLGEDGLDGLWLREAVAKDYCNAVAQRFEEEANSREDDVPGRELGISQYGKTPEHYFGASYSSVGVVERVLGGPSNPIRAQMRVLADVLAARGRRMRPAVWRGEPSPGVRITNWMRGNDEYLLHLHDDWAQIKAAHVGAFEVKDVVRVTAFNIYIQSVMQSGQLELWNWRPSDADRKQLGIESSGYPVERTSIPTNAGAQVIEVETGDIVCIDGSLLHGVRRGEGQIKSRLLIHTFLGLLADGDVLFWS